MTKKLQHLFALSEKGAKDLVKAVIWCFVCNVALMLPIGAVLFTVQHLLGCMESSGSPMDGFWIYVGFGAAVLVLLFVLHWFQYASLYLATYKESANRRVSLAETLRRLPLSFFGNRDLSDLTSTMIADCSSLDQMFSHYVPQLFASIFSTLVIGVAMFLCDWRMRLDVAEILGLRDKKKFSFLFVTDFPQFEYSEEEKRYVSTHHPFTMPYPEDLQYLFTDPAKVRAQAYDVVLNGIELGSGSIRIHRQDIQEKMFEALGFDKEQIEKRFGFMVNAFRYGTPPHGGFAFGLDRLVMLLLGADSLRDVIAFPKIKDASCPMTDAPTPVDPEQLAVLGLDKLWEADTEGTGEKKENVPQIDVAAVAGLARLSFSAEEMQSLQADMKNIIAFANQLSQADTTGAAAAEHIVPMENVFRPDEAEHLFEREELLAAAKTKEDGYITVPRVVEG